jgi:hypothetical protein
MIPAATGVRGVAGDRYTNSPPGRLCNALHGLLSAVNQAHTCRRLNMVHEAGTQFSHLFCVRS